MEEHHIEKLAKLIAHNNQMKANMDHFSAEFVKSNGAIDGALSLMDMTQQDLNKMFTDNEHGLQDKVKEILNVKS